MTERAAMEPRPAAIRGCRSLRSRFDPVTDGVASVGLDMMLKKGCATKRGGYDPYLLGY